MKLIYFIFFLSIFPIQAESRQSNDVLRIGLTGKYPPFNYYNSQGELTGFDVDISSKLCEKINRKCEFIILQWDGIIASLLADKIDVIVGSMAITQEREKKVAFSTPYYESGAQVFVRDQDIDIHNPGIILGVTLGTTYEQVAKELFPQAEIKTYRGDIEILQDLKSYRLDAMITDRLVGSYMINEFGAELFFKGEPLYQEKMAIPLKPGNSKLLREINQAIVQIRESAYYLQLMEKYFSLSKFSFKRNDTSKFSWKNSFKLLISGALASLRISSIGLLLGGVISAIFASLMLFSPLSLRIIIKLLCDFIRATPFIIQLFAVYFGLPAIGFKVSAFNAAVITIGFHSSAYLAEVLVTGHASVPLAQKQAAQLLGLNRWQSLFHIVIPQMIPVVMVPSLNTIVAMIKDSAIVSVISVYELTMQTQQLISTSFKPFEFYLIAAGLYGVMTYPLILIGRRFELRLKRKGLIHA